MIISTNPDDWTEEELKEYSTRKESVKIRIKLLSFKN